MSSNVLVTGGCGFIGSNFLNTMVRKYPLINFYNIDCINYCASLDNIDNSTQQSSNYKFYNCRIQNTNILEILNDNSITHIIHFAAQTHVDTSFVDSSLFIQDNIVATHVLLEAVKEYKKLTLFLYVSTDEVYGETFSKVTEDTPLNPTNPYAATKASSEMLIQSYKYSFKIPTIIIRINNVYGPRQYTEKLIPKFITCISTHFSPPIHGNGMNKRSFLYVYDLINAIDILLERGQIGETYNIGSNDEYSVIDIFNILSNEMNSAIPATFVQDRVFNDSRYLIDYTKISNLGYKQEYSFIQGITETIEWYKT